jgi:hypothetical protein
MMPEEGFLPPADTLAEALQSADLHRCLQALQQLAERPPERRWIPKLMVLREDPNPQVQAAAASLLHRWSQPGHLPPHRDPYGQFGL